MRSTTISIQYVARLAEAARRRDIDFSEFLRTHELSHEALAQPDRRVPTSTYLDLWQFVSSRSKDATLPIDAAKLMDSSAFGALGFAVATSATFGDAVQRICRFLPFVTDAAIWETVEVDDAVKLDLLFFDDLRPEHQLAKEFSFVHMVLSGRALTGQNFNPERVEFEYADSPTRKALEKFFDCPIHFGKKASALLLHKNVMALPLKKADAKMARFFDKYIEDSLDRSDPSREFERRVKLILAQSLSRNSYALTDIAKQLTMGTRTLRRRLSDSGVNYRDLLETVRRELAERHLTERKMSIGEIAYSLGYAEPAVFVRAVKRWFRVTPKEYRAQHFPSRM